MHFFHKEKYKGTFLSAMLWWAGITEEAIILPQKQWKHLSVSKYCQTFSHKIKVGKVGKGKDL
jgi:hypothetical protein